MEKLPENLRCKRSDGKKWRCKRQAWKGMTLCEKHYFQGKLRNKKEKVPESLKLQREKTNSKKRNRESDGPQDEEIRARKMEKGPNPRPAKRRRNVVISEALEGALRKMKLKKGDLLLELIKVFLKCKVEKKKERELKGESEKGKEVIKEMRYGVMAIAQPSPHQEFDNVSSYCHVKVGVEPRSIFSRCFRSKNIDPIPISTKQIVPYARNVAKLKKKKRNRCHWCHQSGYRTFIQCLKCRKQYFCTDCISERPDISKEKIKEACPACEGTCTCRACSRSTPNNNREEAHIQELPRKEISIDHVAQLQYVLNMLLPVLGEINQEQHIELEYEAKIQGKMISEIPVRQVDLSSNNLLRCNNCQTFLVDLHRRCGNCSYIICLGCLVFFRDRRHSAVFDAGEESMSRFIRSKERADLLMENLEHGNSSRKGLSGGSNSIIPSWNACNNDGSIICPPTGCGGCGDGVLGLASLFPLGWTDELAANAKQIVSRHESPQNLYASPCCSICNRMENKASEKKLVMLAASREDSFDNSLYYPMAKDLQNERLDHFRYHWFNGHPVIIREVLKSRPNLSWDPITMFCAYLEKSSTRSQNDKAATSTNCLDLCEMEIYSKQMFAGSLSGGSISYRNMWNEMLKLKVWLSSDLFQEMFPVHHAEIIRSLPLQGYLNPLSGLFNLAADQSENAKRPELGPFVHISSGSSADLKQDDSLTKLYYESHDMVNILVHATDVPTSKEQLAKIKKLMKKCSARDRELPPTKNASEKRKENALADKSLVVSNNTESGLQNTKGKELALPNGKSKSSCFNGDSRAARRSSANDGSGSSSGAAIVLSGNIQSSEEPDILNTFRDCDENGTCSGEETEADTCGAQWDIFRREDVPELSEYLLKHSKEFRDTHCFPPYVVHPILDRCFYLDTTHKAKLKKEFGIEPWTFEQRPGEAVIIPAGCPYQIRRLQSCVNVVLNFISPESITESISLNDALCLLPKQHEARKNVLEVQNMTLHSISTAVKEMQSLKGAN